MAFIRLVFRRGNGVAGCVTSVKHNHLSRHLLLEKLRERGDGCRNDALLVAHSDIQVMFI